MLDVYPPQARPLHEVRQPSTMRDVAPRRCRTAETCAIAATVSACRAIAAVQRRWVSDLSPLADGLSWLSARLNRTGLGRISATSSCTDLRSLACLLCECTPCDCCRATPLSFCAMSTCRRGQQKVLNTSARGFMVISAGSQNHTRYRCCKCVPFFFLVCCCASRR